MPSTSLELLSLPLICTLQRRLQEKVASEEQIFPDASVVSPDPRNNTPPNICRPAALGWAFTPLFSPTGPPRGGLFESALTSTPVNSLINIAPNRRTAAATFLDSLLIRGHHQMFARNWNLNHGCSFPISSSSLICRFVWNLWSFLLRYGNF